MFTAVTLVFPLTNFAAGLMRDETPEQHDFKDFNHASIAGGVEALRLWANYWATEDDSPREHLILDWQHAPDLLQLLDPTKWTYTVLLGTYNESFESEGVAVWTDIHPRRGSGRHRRYRHSHRVRRRADPGVHPGP